MSWSTPFEDPISLAGGKQLVTLEGAARYIQSLPKAEQQRAHWQLAVAILIDCAEGRDFLMHARIGMLRTKNQGKREQAITPRRKSTKAYRIIR